MTRLGIANNKLRQGDPTVYKDIVVEGYQMYPAPAGPDITAPIFDVFLNDGGLSPGVAKYIFVPPGGPPFASLFFTVEVPHNHKVGTSILPHVHYSTDGGGGGPGDIGWELEYTLAAPGAVFPPTTVGFPLISTTLDMPFVHEYSGLYSPPPPAIVIPSTPVNVSTIIQCRLSRGSAVPDTYGSVAYLHSVSFHYEVDDLGSIMEWNKE